MFHEKVVRLKLSNEETMIIYGEKLGKNLRLISYTQAQKYLPKKCYTFLAHILDKKIETKEIKDIPQVCNHPDVSPEDLPRLSMNRQVEFRIDTSSNSLLSWKGQCSGRHFES